MVESFACLEQCNGRHKLCPEVTMVYNKENSMLFATSHYNNENKEKKESIQKTVRNLPSYKNGKEMNRIVVIDVDDPLFKKHIDTYRSTLQSDADLFLYKSDELTPYMEKLDKYKEVVYLEKTDECKELVYL